MKVTLGSKGLSETFQGEFPETTECCKCNGEARIGFVAHERGPGDEPVYPRDYVQFVTDLHENEGKGGYWLHDCCSVAVYFCRECLSSTALWNQG